MEAPIAVDSSAHGMIPTQEEVQWRLPLNILAKYFTLWEMATVLSHCTNDSHAKTLGFVMVVRW